MIKLKEKIGYGLGDMSSSMFWKLFRSYLMIFYTDVFGLPAAVVGTMFLITRVWDSVSDPLMGMIADRTNTRYGKFRPYILWGAIPFGIMGILTFTTPELGLGEKIIYAYITYTLMMTAYTVINVPYASLLGVISPNSSDRNILSSYRMAFAYIGSFLALLMFMPLVNFFTERLPGYRSVENGWTIAVSIIAVICILLFFLTFALTRERVKSVSKQAKVSEDLKDLMRNKPWWLLLGAGVAALIFNSIRDGATVYYFKYYIQEESISNISLFNISFVLSGLYLAIGQIANIIGVIISAPLSNKIGKKSTYIGSMAVATVLSIIFFWISKENLILIFIFQVLISICAGSIFPLLWSMYADCADYSEYKTSNRATGLIFSSSSMSQELCLAIGRSPTGLLVGYFGFQRKNEENPGTIKGIKMFMSLLPAAGTILSIVFISFYPLSEKRMKRISTALQRKRNVLD